MRSLRSPLPIRPCAWPLPWLARSLRSLSRAPASTAIALALLRCCCGRPGTRPRARWAGGDADRAVGLVDVLAAGATGAEGVDAQVGRVERDLLGLVGLGQHATVQALVWMRPCASVAGTRCTRCRRLELQPPVSPFALDAEQHHFLVAAELGWRFSTIRLGAPALALGVSAGTCGPGRRRTGRRLVAAGAGADLGKALRRRRGRAAAARSAARRPGGQVGGGPAISSRAISAMSGRQHLLAAAVEVASGAAGGAGSARPATGVASACSRVSSSEAPGVGRRPLLGQPAGRRSRLAQEFGQAGGHAGQAPELPGGSGVSPRAKDEAASGNGSQGRAGTVWRRNRRDTGWRCGRATGVAGAQLGHRAVQHLLRQAATGLQHLVDVFAAASILRARRSRRRQSSACWCSAGSAAPRRAGPSGEALHAGSMMASACSTAAWRSRRRSALPRRGRRRCRGRRRPGLPTSARCRAARPGRP